MVKFKIFPSKMMPGHIQINYGIGASSWYNPGTQTFEHGRNFKRDVISNEELNKKYKEQLVKFLIKSI